LNAQSKDSFWPNHEIKELSKTNYTGFEMAWASEGENAVLLKGTLAEALAKGREFGAHFVHVYEGDCNNKMYDKLLSSW
jgi:hypothetical protein